MERGRVLCNLLPAASAWQAGWNPDGAVIEWKMEKDITDSLRGGAQ